MTPEEKLHKIISHAKELIESENWGYFIDGVKAILAMPEESISRSQSRRIAHQLDEREKNQIAKRKIDNYIFFMLESNLADSTKENKLRTLDQMKDWLDQGGE